MSQYIVSFSPPLFSGNPQTIWKYNALYYLISEHSNFCVIPEISGELLVNMFIQKAEEELIRIQLKSIEGITKSLIVMGQ